MKQKKFSRREITFKLTDEELLAKGQEAASISKEKGEIEAEFSSVKAEFRERIEEKEVALSAALAIIRDKSETKASDVIDFFDYEHGSVETYVGDRLIGERALTNEELQIGFDFGSKKAPSTQGELDLLTTDPPAAAAGEVDESKPIDLANMPEDWFVDLPDATKVAGLPADYEQYVPGTHEHVTVVRASGKSYLLEAGEAATFALETEEAFGQPVRVWRKIQSSKLGESLPGQPPVQPTA